MLLIGGAAMRAWPMFIDIGTQDARFVTSFNEPEQANGMRFRWTRERSILHLPRPPAGPAILTMHVVNGYPDHIPAPQLRVSSSTHQLAEFRVAGWREGTRTYRMLVPVEPSFDWWKPIILDSTFYLPADDPRPLGAVLDYVQLTPSTISLPLPTAHTLIMAFALGMLLFTALLLMGLHHRLSFTITLMVAALLALATWIWTFLLLAKSDVHNAYYVAGHVMAGIACICTSLVALVATIVRQIRNSYSHAERKWWPVMVLAMGTLSILWGLLILKNPNQKNWK